jgi:hypothetical protein
MHTTTICFFLDYQQQSVWTVTIEEQMLESHHGLIAIVILVAVQYISITIIVIIFVLGGKVVVLNNA